MSADLKLKCWCGSEKWEVHETHFICCNCKQYATPMVAAELTDEQHKKWDDKLLDTKMLVEYMTIQLQREHDESKEKEN